MSTKPIGLPNKRKAFHCVDLYLQTCRLFTLTFITEWSFFVKQTFVYMGMMLYFISVFKRDMVDESGCVPREGANVTEAASCLSQLGINTLIKENVFFLLFSCQIFVYFLMNSACMTISQLVNVFRNEHRNSK